jgi:hypothetical protein
VGWRVKAHIVVVVVVEVRRGRRREGWSMD